VQTGPVRIKPTVASLWAAAATVLGLVSCAGQSGQAAPRAGAADPAAASSATNWPTYHADAARSGLVRGLPAAGRLAIGWSRGLDGAVYGQPLVIGDTVIAATEKDTVYGLARATGRIRWKRHIATPLPLGSQPCGNIGPLGITSTPVFYRKLVYVLAQDGRTRHLLVGFDPATGGVRYRRLVRSPDRHPYYDQQRGALAAGNGRIYVAFGGHFGDCGPYSGSVVGIPAAGPGAGSKPVVSYRVPSPRAGIWAPGGPVIGQNGTVYIGVGNGGASGPYNFSDSVTALSPRLHRIGVFAPASWRSDNLVDLDLGSMTPALTSAGLILAVGKRGVGYLLRASHLGGVGGQIASRPVCAAFGGAAVRDAMVIVPCAGGGPAAVTTRRARLRVLWRGPSAADGSAVIGGGAVWVLATASGVLYELNPRTGNAVHQVALGAPLPHFASPSLSGRLVLVGTLHGVVAVNGA
jgi:outer membrane protein assembly factor BamB